MNILIDATWIGGMYGTKVMHGGLRVTNEFLKGLHDFKQHQFFLTNTNYLKTNIVTLNKYVNEVIGGSNVKVHARKMQWLHGDLSLKLYARLSRYIPFPYLYPFIDDSFLQTIDVYHAPNDPIPGIIRRNKKIKKFFTSLDLIPLVRPDLSTNFYDYTKVLYDTLTPDVNVLAISESTKKDLLEYRKDLHPDKVRVTYLAADEDKFYLSKDEAVQQQVLSKYNLAGKKYLLSVNSMARYKNVEFTIKNFSEYITANGVDDLHLVIIGQNREHNYKEYIETAYGNGDRMTVLDYVDDNDLVHLYNGAMGFLYMSLYEGFGLPILEAMQCGTPVICSNTSSMPEVAGNAAIQVSPLSHVDFKSALHTLYSNEEKRRSMKADGLLQAAKFSWAKYAREVVNAYEEM